MTYLIVQTFGIVIVMNKLIMCDSNLDVNENKS